MIELLNVIKDYGNYKLKIEHIIFEETGLYLVVGESGSGKTTFFDMITNRIKYEGLITIKGDISYYYQGCYYNGEMSLHNIVCLIDNCDLKFYHILIDKLNAKYFLHTKMKYLSIGERQRVELIVTLIKKASVYIFDEPICSLNKEYSKKFIEAIKRISKNHLALVSSHKTININCTKIVINKGVIIQENVISRKKNNSYIKKHVKNNKYNLIVHHLIFNKTKYILESFSMAFSLSAYAISTKLDDYLSFKLNKEIINDSNFVENIILKCDFLFDNLSQSLLIIVLINFVVFIAEIYIDYIININKVKSMENIIGNKEVVKKCYMLKILYKFLFVLILFVTILLNLHIFVLK